VSDLGFAPDPTGVLVLTTLPRPKVGRGGANPHSRRHRPPCLRRLERLVFKVDDPLNVSPSRRRCL